MQFKVSRILKSKGIKKEVSKISADHFTVQKPDSLFDHDGGVSFYNDVLNWRNKVTSSALIAFLPGTDWIIESEAAL